MTAGPQCLSSQFNHSPTPPLSPAHSINKPFLTFAQDVTLPTSLRQPTPLRFFTVMRSFTSHLRLISHCLLAIKPQQPLSINSQGYGFERDCCHIKTLQSESLQSSCALQNKVQGHSSHLKWKKGWWCANYLQTSDIDLSTFWTPYRLAKEVTK